MNTNGGAPMYRDEIMFEHNDNRPAIAALNAQRAIQFLMEHFSHANLQRPGETEISAPDLRFSSNENFWQKLLYERNMALRWVELSRFKIVDWFPRAPGLYHTREAAYARQEAEQYVREEDGIRFYDPRGKSHMMQGGVGSVRFKPIFLEGQEHLLCTATSDGYAHSGVPIAIPSHFIESIDFSDYSTWFKISGRVKFLPRFLEEYFSHQRHVPQVYVLVENLDVLAREKSGSPVRITPMVFFTGEIPEIRLPTRGRFQDVERANVTFVTCRADSVYELDKAADWLDRYAQKFHGEIVTNFDEQRPVFQYAPFSLQNVMSGRLDSYRMRGFHIDHAEFVCETINNVHSEAATMTQIDLKLGDGATIHGDFVVATSIKDSFNKANSSSAPDDLKDLLTRLATAVGKMTERLPMESAQQVARDLDTLIAEATSATPRHQWQLSMDGLNKAAQDIGELGKPVIELANLLLPLLSR